MIHSDLFFSDSKPFFLTFISNSIFTLFLLTHIISKIFTRSVFWFIIFTSALLMSWLDRLVWCCRSTHDTYSLVEHGVFSFLKALHGFLNPSSLLFSKGNEIGNAVELGASRKYKFQEVSASAKKHTCWQTLKISFILCPLWFLMNYTFNMGLAAAPALHGVSSTHL